MVSKKYLLIALLPLLSALSPRAAPTNSRNIKFCGSNLSSLLHAVCASFHEPFTHPGFKKSTQSVTQECCYSSCSLKTFKSYCKTLKNPQPSNISEIFGISDVNDDFSEPAFNNLEKNKPTKNELENEQGENESQQVRKCKRKNKAKRKKGKRKCRCGKRRGKIKITTHVPARIGTVGPVTPVPIILPRSRQFPINNILKEY